MKVVLRLEVEYDTSSYADESDALADVQNVLHTSIEHMIGNGGLDGNTHAEVESWEVHTDILED
jgi:hypothetical protein